MNKNMPWVWFFYFYSFIYFFSNNSWFLLWISIEMNSMTFLSLLFFYKNTNQLQSCLNYYLIQSSSSCILLYSLFDVESENMFSMLNMKFFFLLAVFLKLSASPFHSWLISLVNNMTFWLLWMILSLQKIMPYMILILMKMKPMVMLIMIMSTSAVMGSFLNFRQMSINKILTMSGISNTSWLLASIFMSFYIWSIYFIIYILTTFLIIMTKLMINMKQMNMTNLSSKIMILLLFMSLAGLPPLMGFLPKILIMNKMQEMMLLFLVFIMLIMNSIDFFIYMRYCHLNFIWKYNKMIWTNAHIKPLKFYILFFLFFLLFMTL